MSNESPKSIRTKTECVSHPLAAFKQLRRQQGADNLPKSIRLQINMKFQNQIEFQACKPILLGREASENNEVESLDLSEFQARELGVSRLHAEIFLAASQVFIRDLKSYNGTFLNDEELYPLRSYTLQDGDTIRLGKISIRVFFVY